ncbi:MAG: hypothetical protein IJ991_18155, partial [Thermoguttaceae bacterium]|nr:hypothetical protein [Thermoguttaceae bacterium]
DDRDDDEQVDEGEAASAAKRREKLRTKLHCALLVEKGRERFDFGVELSKKVSRRNLWEIRKAGRNARSASTANLRVENKDTRPRREFQVF